MRDGVKLFTSIYTPKNTSSPILFSKPTPYDIEPGGPGFNFFMQVYARYTRDEYIMVFQDVQGKIMSEGEFEDIRPVIACKKEQ